MTFALQNSFSTTEMFLNTSTLLIFGGVRVLTQYIDKDSSLSSKNADIAASFRFVFQQIKEDLEDHLESINQNTDEIQSNYSYLCEIDSKINKLGERLDQIEMFLKKSAGLKVEEKPIFNISPLTKREQEIFLVLYTLDGMKDNTTYKDLAKRCGLTEQIAMGYVDNLMRKGIPITRKIISNKICLKINSYFKTLQAKENILKLNQKMLF